MSNEFLPPDMLEFNTLPNVTTCQSIDITWSYSGAANDTVLVGLFGYTDPGVDPSNPGGSDELQELITPNISITAEQVSYQVNVPVGEYQIQAYDVNDVLFGSTPFYVNDGSDTSCMGAYSSWITPSASANSSSGSKLSRGAIAGIVIGVVAAVVAALILLGVYARKRRMARLANRDRRGWTSLNSLKAPLGSDNIAAFPEDIKAKPATGIKQPMSIYLNVEKNGPTHDF